MHQATACDSSETLNFVGGRLEGKEQIVVQVVGFAALGGDAVDVGAGHSGRGGQ